MASQLKIDQSPYQLMPIETSQRKSRTGSLLRFTFPDGRVGFSDCHPWPELGDAPLEEQLILLKEGILTKLTEKSLYFARVDAQARGEERSLFKGLSIPKSHWHAAGVESLNNETLQSLLNAGFDTIKFKWGSDFQDVLPSFRKLWTDTPLSTFNLRFDFNERLTYRQFTEFLTMGNEWIDRVEFFEDPVPFEKDVWSSIKSEFNIKLACDRSALIALDFHETCDYLVVKPAVESIEPFVTSRRGGRKLVVTSYLDHPIGVLAAAYTAAKVKIRFPEALAQCGLLTHHSYQPTPFCNRMRDIVPTLNLQNDDAGWGYYQNLAELKWNRLV